MLTSTTSTMPTTPSSDVPGLLQQRAQLQDWLARLDEVQRDADAHIVERIRGDYQDRLRAVLEALAAHLDALRADRADREEALRAAEAERQGARDALEEARLRHRIGELPDPAWQQRRQALEAGLESAEERCQEIGAEAARLAEILAQIEDGPAETAAPDRADAAEPSPADPNDESLSPTIRMDMAEIAMITASLAPEDAESEPADEAQDGSADPDQGTDLAFLEELDRAIEASLSSTGGKAPIEDNVTADETPEARSGAKCPDCGYTNDPEAWYCGVCGVDLA